MRGAVRTEELTAAGGWVLFFSKEGCGDLGPVSVNVFTFFPFQGLKAGSAMNQQSESEDKLK